MRKLISLLLCGVAALSFGAFAADTDTKATTGATAGGDAKGDANPPAPTASDNAKSEKRSEPQGTAKDSHQTNPKPGKQAKRNKDQAGAGATSGERKY